MFALGCGVSGLAVMRGGSATAPAPAPSFPAESRPAGFTIANTATAAGDSTDFGVGVPTGQSVVDKMRAGVTSGPSAQNWHLAYGSGNNAGATKGDQLGVLYFGNAGCSGQNTAYIANLVQLVKTNYPAEIARFWFLSGGLNDYNTGVTGWSRDWPAQVKTNFAAMAAAIDGIATDYFFMLAPPESSNAPGTSIAADHKFHRRDMLATYGRRVVDQARWLRFQRARENPDPANADALALTLGVIPYSYRGYTNTGVYAQGDPAIAVQAAGPTIGGAGTDGALIWATTPAKMYRCGNEGWQVCEIKHPGVAGNVKGALLGRDVQAASEASGPPLANPIEMRCAKDVAHGAAVGQLVYTGAVTAFALADYAGTISPDFAVSNTGAVTRLGTGALADGLTQLMVAATNANGTLYSPLDIYITRPSTMTAPQMRTIAAPGLSIAGRQAWGAVDGPAFSFAFWVNMPLTATQFLYFLNGSTGFNPAYCSISTNGKLSLVLNQGGANILPTTTTASVVANTDVWLFGKVNASTVQLYAGDTAKAFTVGAPGGNYALSTASPVFLANTPGNQIKEPVSPLTGGCGFLAFWDADIDWSVQATRRQLMNADGSPLAGRTPYSAVGGTAPRMEMWGGKGDWLYGTPDGSNGRQTMSLDYRALTRMS